MPHHLCVCCTIRIYAVPSHAMLHCLYVSCTIQNYTEPFHTTLHCLCVRCATWHYPEPFDATLHHLFTVLQRSARLFAIELVHFTISISNSTWATRLFIIWLNYSCLGCSVSWRKSKLSIIWPCHSFISYAVLQLILKPALFLLIYLTSWYFWWWRPLSAKLFAIELVHFTISISNSTWATRPFIIWLNYSCLGCSVSWRKSKLSIIWPCHSFISYAVLQLILKPALFLLIYLTSWYFWWWRPPIMMTKPQSQIPY